MKLINLFKEIKLYENAIDQTIFGTWLPEYRLEHANKIEEVLEEEAQNYKPVIFGTPADILEPFTKEITYQAYIVTKDLEDLGLPRDSLKITPHPRYFGKAVVAFRGEERVVSLEDFHLQYLCMENLHTKMIKAAISAIKGKPIFSSYHDPGYMLNAIMPRNEDVEDRFEKFFGITFKLEKYPDFVIIWGKPERIDDSLLWQLPATPGYIEYIWKCPEAEYFEWFVDEAAAEEHYRTDTDIWDTSKLTEGYFDMTGGKPDWDVYYLDCDIRDIAYAEVDWRLYPDIPEDASYDDFNAAWEIVLDQVWYNDLPNWIPDLLENLGLKDKIKLISYKGKEVYICPAYELEEGDALLVNLEAETLESTYIDYVTIEEVEPDKINKLVEILESYRKEVEQDIVEQALLSAGAYTED